MRPLRRRWRHDGGSACSAAVVREILRYPEATIPRPLHPAVLLAVNIGQVSPTFPDTTPFLKGQDTWRSSFPSR